MLKLQRYRPGDAADMSLVEFVGRCVPGTWCLVWAGLMCACARLFLRQSRLWVGVPKPDPRIHHPTFPQQARGTAAGAAGKPGAEGHGPAPDAATKKRSGSRGQRIEQGTDRWRRLST